MTPLINIGSVFNSNNISTQIVNQYIQFADSQIDATLSQLYVTPLCQMADFQTKLLSNIDDTNPMLITQSRCPFYPGDSIVITDGINEHRSSIQSVVGNDNNGSNFNNNIFTLTDNPMFDFDAQYTRIMRISFPQPIPLTSARIAAASIYQKYFMAQADPSKSQYGKYLRGLVRQDLDNVLNGRTILHGQHRIGRRFFNSTLSDRYGLPGQGQKNIDQQG